MQYGEGKHDHSIFYYIMHKLKYMIPFCPFLIIKEFLITLKHFFEELKICVSSHVKK